MYHNKRRDRTYVIPHGTVSSMSTFIAHTDPEVFGDPYKFRPQRWFELSCGFIAFSRGPRNCVG